MKAYLITGLDSTNPEEVKVLKDILDKGLTKVTRIEAGDLTIYLFARPFWCQIKHLLTIKWNVKKGVV